MAGAQGRAARATAAVTTKNGDFGNLVDATGRPFDDELRAERQRTLLSLLAMQPHVVMTEMFPFGRRAFRAELLPLLDAASALRPRPLVLASVRDILVSKPDPTRYRWMAEACTHYDHVMHGDERLMPFSASFPGGRGRRLHRAHWLHSSWRPGDRQWPRRRPC